MAENVGAFMETKGCAHVIYFSSDAVYKDGIALVREETEKDPGGLYGMTQFTREKMIAHSASKAKIPLTIVRPSAVYGRGDTHNGYGPNRFWKLAAEKGEITLFGEGEEQRDHIYVDDVCKLVSLCAFHKTTGTVNLVTGKAVSFGEVARQVADNAGSSVKITCLPRQNSITHKAFDTTVLLKAFPNFSFTSLEDGVKRMKI